MTTYLKLMNWGKRQLFSVTDEAELESEIFLLDAFDLKKVTLLQNLTQPVLNSQKIKLFKGFITKRITGKPLAYVLENCEFMGESFDLEEGVLIPRPETELLVEKAIEALFQFPDLKNNTVLEFGFGSGIISIILAKKFPNVQFFSWDISPISLRVAQKNAKKHRVKNITWVCKDFFEDQENWKGVIEQSGRVLFVSNPPYIPQDDIETLDPVVKDFEPHMALSGGENGLVIYEKLLICLKHYDLSMVMEIGVNQKPLLTQLLKSKGYQKFEFFEDLQRIFRVFSVYDRRLSSSRLA